MNDYSCDNSNKIIEKYLKKDNRIKLINLNQNLDVAKARNKGIEVAKGRYIAFLDSDDLRLPHKLEVQLKFMKDNDLSFTYSSYRLINENGINMGKFIVKPKISYNFMLKICSVGCLTAMYNTKKLCKIYMPLNANKREDYATWLKILKLINHTNGLLEITSCYRLYNKF
nr:glycosyltransferase family 2 protein [Campylobacter sputorum]